MDIKQSLYNQCNSFVEKRLQSIQKTISEIQESLLSETKNSAGDKHETGRAMLQLEREKAGQQLAEAQRLKEALGKIDVKKPSNNIRLGSAVYTTQANYFIAISAGKLTVGGIDFFAISPNTPIGQILLSKRDDDEVVFGEQTIKIKAVF